MSLYEKKNGLKKFWFGSNDARYNTHKRTASLESVDAIINDEQS
jgi:hypothetical protein